MIWKIMQIGEEPNNIILNFFPAEKIACFCGAWIRIFQIWHHKNLIELLIPTPWKF